jgi:hypothetical protein
MKLDSEERGVTYIDRTIKIIKEMTKTFKNNA